LEVKLDFLPEGRYEMANWSDSKESDNDPKLLLLEKRIIKSNESIKVAMAKNGGFVATFKKIQF
jgi:hypothetical protein